jgi:DNA-binding Lrp family transcriptional regulator
MIGAYILAKVQGGKEKTIREELSGSEFVKELTFVHGEYDMLLKVEAQDLEELDGFLFNKLRQISGVKETMTLIVAYV